MWNAIYIHSMGETPAALGACSKCMAVQVNSTPLKQVVELLCDAQCATLVLPNDYREHCPTVEHVKSIAHHMGLTVQPLTRYLADVMAANEPATTPATAAAAPTNEAVAVAG